MGSCLPLRLEKKTFSHERKLKFLEKRRKPCYPVCVVGDTVDRYLSVLRPHTNKEFPKKQADGQSGIAQHALKTPVFW